MTTTTELAQEFAVTVRGYDRAQVDSYVDTLREWLGNATLRMEAAEADNAGLREQVVLLRSRLAQLEDQVGGTPPRTIEALGDRVSQILLLAEEGATAVTADAEAEAVSILGRARQEADDLLRATKVRQAEMEAIIASANQRATTLVDRAEAEAAEIVNRLRAESETRAAAREADAEAKAVARETEAAERARVTIAAAEAERDRIRAQLAEEKVAMGADLHRLAAERDEVRGALTRLKDSLHRTISEMGEGAAPTTTRVTATVKMPEDPGAPPPGLPAR
ncbi:MAG TPA: DivIVA domain-containing protein [Acidimicrobiales bacterium]|nr:DivIVA domain-containing protein [Acidimicrobiales bacterium]